MISILTENRSDELGGEPTYSWFLSSDRLERSLVGVECRDLRVCAETEIVEGSYFRKTTMVY
jgi:hypothetical protein